jgi:Photoprotection regulator fluorescence recovery protein
MNNFEYEREMRWSDVEKKVARRAFDLALQRECTTIAAEVRKLLAEDSNPMVVWGIHDYLSEQRRMFDTKYDYRYSVLINLFGLLVAERWLSLDDLAGLRDEKIERIERSATFYHHQYPAPGHASGGAPESHPRS